MTAYTDALARLTTAYYNNGLLTIANPGGFAANGHYTNFPLALADVGIVFDNIDDSLTALAAQSAGFTAALAAAAADAAAAAASAAAAGASAADALAAKIAAEAAAGTFTKATAAEIRAKTEDAHYFTAKGLSDAGVSTALADAATIAWDMSTGWNKTVTIGASRTLGAPTNSVEGDTGSLRVIWGGAGGWALSFHACWDFQAVGVPNAVQATGTDAMLYWQCVDAATPRYKATWMAGV